MFDSKLRFFGPTLLLVLSVSVFLFVTGHIFDGPQLVDDNQISRLQIELREDGFVQVLGTEFASRFEMRRLVPVYLIQKVVLARVFGGNLVAWSLYTGLVAALAAGLLFHFFRLCHGKPLESLAFALITLVGEQSVVWWRMLQGEGIGMLMLSISLVLMVLAINTQKLRYEIGWALFLTLATLSKESFMLVIPAVLFLKIWIAAREQRISFAAAARQNWLSLTSLTLIFVVELAVIKFGFATTSFAYAGWKGFDATALQNMLKQYAQITNVYLLGALVLVALLTWLFHRNSDKNNSSKQRKRETSNISEDKHGPPIALSFQMAAVFCLLMTLPQLLLYMSTGMLNVNDVHHGRYILPCIIGYAFLVAESVRLVRLKTGDNLTITILMACMLVGSILNKSVIAYQEAVAYAFRSQQNDTWFEAVVNNTERDSPIVLVFFNSAENGESLNIPMRAYYLLSEYYDRKNIYVSPIPLEPSIERGRLKMPNGDTKRHANRMRSVDQLDQSRQPAAIMIINWGRFGGQPISVNLDNWLRNTELTWFEPRDYRRKVHSQRHITYFLNN